MKFTNFQLAKQVLSKLHNAKRPIILGIETSCDDTAVAIVSADKQTLGQRVYVERTGQGQFGGINPAISASQHRGHLDRLIEEVLDEVQCRASDLDAVAVTTRPGLVICLKVGIERALAVARNARLPLLPVHHMRAHALAGRLVDPDLQYPFLSLLVSGGHCLLVLVKGPTDFDLIGTAGKSSPGECIDKVGRAIGVDCRQRHYGAEVERLASLSSPEGPFRFEVKTPITPAADFNFDSLKSSYLQALLDKYKGIPADESDLIDFCASLQYQVTSHICRKLHVALDFLCSKTDIFAQNTPRSLVLSGGVAANRFISTQVGKICAHHGFTVVSPPPRLCTDNAEMIAWAGVEMFNEKNPDIISHLKLPSSIYAVDREPIGTSNLRTAIANYKVSRKLQPRSLFSERLSFYGKPIT
uniref:N(6)-L-threonylcarbamoyladenine synthase n=1 Tax=Panagrellus redivivus TaxID=6233 RepID=A0A7E4UWX0_PANRE